LSEYPAKSKVSEASESDGGLVPRLAPTAVELSQQQDQLLLENALRRLLRDNREKTWRQV
jgi:hypothetical protein